MIGLISFGRFIIPDLGNEQFYAFYLSSGMIASYVSYLAKFLLKTTSVASLGASGAVFAVTFSLYQLPIVIIIYPVVVGLFFLIIFLLIDHRKQMKHYQELEHCR